LPSISNKKEKKRSKQIQSNADKQFKSISLFFDDEFFHVFYNFSIYKQINYSNKQRQILRDKNDPTMRSSLSRYFSKNTAHHFQILRWCGQPNLSNLSSINLAAWESVTFPQVIQNCLLIQFIMPAAFIHSFIQSIKRQIISYSENRLCVGQSSIIHASNFQKRIKLEKFISYGMHASCVWSTAVVFFGLASFLGLKNGRSIKMEWMILKKDEFFYYFHKIFIHTRNDTHEM
jgi:hypothetical protein